MLWELVHAGDSGFELSIDQITGEDVGKEFGSRKAEREMKRHRAQVKELTCWKAGLLGGWYALEAPGSG